jgi:tetratricopeptide (TPR) repeat protein
LGQYTKSVEAYRRAIELSKRPGKELIQLYALNNVGSLLWIEGDLEGAIKANNEAIELDQNFCAAHISLAASYRKMGKKAELIKEVKIINKLIAEESKYNQACFEAIRGNADTAISLLRIAMGDEQQHVEWVRKDPDLEFIHKDPRFEGLMKEFLVTRAKSK